MVDHFRMFRSRYNFRLGLNIYHWTDGRREQALQYLVVYHMACSAAILSWCLSLPATFVSLYINTFSTWLDVLRSSRISQSSAIEDLCARLKKKEWREKKKKGTRKKNSALLVHVNCLYMCGVFCQQKKVFFDVRILLIKECRNCNCFVCIVLG